MTRIVYLLAALTLLAGGGTAAGILVADSSAQTEQTCPGLDTGHIDGGNNTSITITAPAGQLIDSYCVKAGSDNQGDGPVIVAVNPPASSVTISHPSGKELSHYSVSYTTVSTPPPPPDDNPPPPPPPTTTGEEPPPPPPTTTTSTPPPPGPRCPPGMTPTKGKDGQPGNDECEFPPAPPAPPAPVTTTPVTPAVPAATPPPPAVTTTTEETTPAETTPAEEPASTPAQPSEANPPAANSPQPKAGQPAPKPKNKPCPPGTREHNGTCNAIVQGNG